METTSTYFIGAVVTLTIAAVAVGTVIIHADIRWTHRRANAVTVTALIAYGALTAALASQM